MYKSILLLAASLALAACNLSDDAPSALPDGGNNEQPADAGDDDANGANNGGTNDGGINNGETDDGGINDVGGNNGGAQDVGVDMALEPIAIDWPASPAEFIDTSSTVSYVHQLLLPSRTENGDPACCTDFGERSKHSGTDNALLSLADVVTGSLGISVQSAIENGIGAGEVVILLDHREFDGADDADGFALSWLLGSFADQTDFLAAEAGNGKFNVEAESFLSPGDNVTGEPRYVFNPVRVDEMIATMQTNPGEVWLNLPVGVSVIDAPVREARLTGQISSVGSDGVVYVNGTLSGYILLDEFYAGINAYVETNCSCLSLGMASLYEKEDGEWVANCDSNATTACGSNQGNGLCVTMGAPLNDGICDALPNILSGAADVDVDNSSDNTYEGLSIGLEWQAVGGKLQ